MVYKTAYLLFNSMSLGHHGIKVMTFGNTIKHHLLDPGLQVCIGAFQRAHLDQDKERKCRDQSVFILLVLVSFPSLQGAKQTYHHHPSGCNVSDLVQVVGKAAVETLHSFLFVGAVAMQPIELEAHWPVEILADRSGAGQRAGCCERDRRTGASTSSVHQGATGE